MVTRYDPIAWACQNEGIGDMEERATGAFVDYNDYEELHDTYVDLKIRYDNLVRDIGEIYKDA